jgi:predicted lipoprotein with Yx(FWY)xxD motif
MVRSTRPFLCTGLGLSAALTLGACGSVGGSQTAPSRSDQPTVTSTPAAEATAGAQPVAGITATKAPGLGAIVTDDAGRTLYRFDKDTAEPSASNCAGDCASLWPPALADGRPAPSGVDPELLGTVTRADGSTQLTLKGWPVYYFSGDKKPGDVAGQGVKGVWFAVTPDGAKAAGAAPGSAGGSEGRSTEPVTPEPTTSSADDGYGYGY